LITLVSSPLTMTAAGPPHTFEVVKFQIELLNCSVLTAGQMMIKEFGQTVTPVGRGQESADGAIGQGLPQYRSQVHDVSINQQVRKDTRAPGQVTHRCFVLVS
jgi:hypothetical protein